MYIDPDEMNRMTDLLDVIEEKFRLSMELSNKASFTKPEVLQMFGAILFDAGKETAIRHMERLDGKEPTIQ